jgi:hypothetical protein
LDAQTARACVRGVMCTRDIGIVKLLTFLVSLFFVQNIHALSLVCSKGEHSELDLPEEFIVWDIEKDELLGTHYSFELKKTIENVKLESVFLLRRNEEKIDFFMNLSFLEMHKGPKDKFSYAVVGFSLSEQIRSGTELYAVFQRRYENCVPESRKYKIEIPHNKNNH